MFSPVNTAFDVAVTRLVSVPGKRSAKNPGEMPGEVAEQIAPQVASDFDKSGIRDPAR